VARAGPTAVLSPWNPGVAPKRKSSEHQSDSLPFVTGTFGTQLERSIVKWSGNVGLVSFGLEEGWIPFGVHTGALRTMRSGSLAQLCKTSMPWWHREVAHTEDYEAGWGTAEEREDGSYLAHNPKVGG
jgi:hypothetical protein